MHTCHVKFEKVNTKGDSNEPVLIRHKGQINHTADFRNSFGPRLNMTTAKCHEEENQVFLINSHTDHKEPAREPRQENTEKPRCDTKCGAVIPYKVLSESNFPEAIS